MELTTLTIAEAGELLARREISPRELTEAHLERIARLNPQLNCYITVVEERALRQARAAEQAIMGGDYRGPLHGIPIALKDNFETRGVRTSAGSPILARHVPNRDAAVARRLTNAGTILLGKLHMYEWALNVTSANLHFGDCRNPWNLACSAGGSSSGSGAALAAELCLGTLGSDTGGSIRIPAALCGVVGLKPTYGRVSMRGVVPLSRHLDHAGPMTRRVRDAALILQTIAGHDPADLASSPTPIDDYLGGLDSGVRGWRFGLALNTMPGLQQPIDLAVGAAVAAAAEVFTQLGARISPIALPDLREATRANSLILVSDIAADHEERIRTRPHDYGPDALRILERGMSYRAVEYARARATQANMRRLVTALMQTYPLLIMPTTVTPAPPLVELSEQQPARPALTSLTALWNLTGLPSISLPCGFTESGLPIGLQIIGRPWAEAQVLRAAHAYEQATEWHRRRPPHLLAPPE